MKYETKEDWDSISCHIKLVKWIWKEWEKIQCYYHYKRIKKLKRQFIGK